MTFLWVRGGRIKEECISYLGPKNDWNVQWLTELDIWVQVPIQERIIFC